MLGSSAAPEPTSPLLLASRSPRRAALLAAAGIEYEVACCEAVDESLPRGADGAALDPGEAVRRLAVRKARAAVQREPARLLLTADTLVFLDGRPLGKPSDRGEAVRMLVALSGREHLVATGVALAGSDAAGSVRILSDSSRTRVGFRPITHAEIEAYVAGGEPLDKAGAYAIQGGGGAFVSSVIGEEDTVVGLPIGLVRRLIALWREIP